MTQTLRIRCIEPVQAHKAITTIVWPHVKNCLMSGHRMVIEVKQEKRSLSENALLHSLLGEIAAQLQWAGKKLDAEAWKRLLTAAWCRARNEHIEMLPAIDGHGIDIIYRHTSQLTVSECAELIEYVQAWAVDQGVKLKEHRA